ncbi:MAG: hypothetical protein AABY83_08625 [Pseudomonadota bacterium]
MRALTILLINLHMLLLACDVRAAAPDWLDLDNETWWQSSQSEYASDNFAQPIDVNQAGIDELLAVPGVDYVMAQALLLNRPFTENGLHDFLSEQGAAPETIDFLTAQSSLQVVYKEMEVRAGALGGSAETDATARAAPYYYSRARMRFDLPGTHAAGAGLMTSIRPRTAVQYDVGTGSLRSPGPEQQSDIEQAYFYAYFPRWSAVLGSYTIGFGERLVFDNGTAKHTDNWALSDAVREDMRGSRLRFPNNLWGGAVRLAMPSALEGVVFLSSRNHDLYQYDLRYGPDAWAQSTLQACEKPGATSHDYICGEDGRWYKHAVSNGALQNQILRDAYREDLIGAHVGHQYDAWRYGLTAYRATTTFPSAWPSARWSPNAEAMAGGKAVGADLLWEGQNARLAAELAAAQGDIALVLRGLNAWSNRISGDFSARYYGPDFRNPHGRSEASPERVEGYTRRNEVGAHTGLRTRWESLDISVDGDAWFAPFKRNDNGVWRPAAPAWRGRAGGRITTRVAPHTFYLHGYQQRVDMTADPDPGVIVHRAAWRIGALSRWSGGWRSGAEYRALLRAPSVGAALINHHAMLRIGYAAFETWVDIASAPQGEEPQAQGRAAWSYTWGERIKLDAQYGVMYVTAAPSWRHVAALAWEASF